MKYFLRMGYMESTPELEVSSEEYTLLQTARRVLSSALAIEEVYEILVSNYLELEAEILKIALSNTVRVEHDYWEIAQTRSGLNVRLVNLLTATRLYLDQMPQEVVDCLPVDCNGTQLIKDRCSREYDEHFEYRFMEALRNHVQHRGIPIHYFAPGGRWTSMKDDGLLEFTVDIFSQKQFLGDEKFKKAVLSETPGNVNLMAAARQYVESLSAIHQFVRDLTSNFTRTGRGTIQGAHARYAEIYCEKLSALKAYAFCGDREISSIPLLLEWDDVRIRLQQRNKQLVNLRKTYATGRLTKST